jgi:hypothetical protein
MVLPCGAVGGTEELGGHSWELVLVARSWGCICLPVFVCGKDEAVHTKSATVFPGATFTLCTCTIVAPSPRLPVESGILLSRNSH